MPGRKGRAPRVVPRRVVSFGAQAPERPGDWGLVVENDMSWLARARDDDVSPRELTLQHLMPADALRVRGRHNALNALAALALATAIGCPLAPMLHALREYRGERHRVEFVAAVDGVDAFDDSKGTNVGATVAALEGLGVERAPAKLVVILGGDGKGQDFAPLGELECVHRRLCRPQLVLQLLRQEDIDAIEAAPEKGRVGSRRTGHLFGDGAAEGKEGRQTRILEPRIA